jgi:hypothetical protein
MLPASFAERRFSTLPASSLKIRELNRIRNFESQIPAPSHSISAHPFNAKPKWENTISLTDQPSGRLYDRFSFKSSAYLLLYLSFSINKQNNAPDQNY